MVASCRSVSLWVDTTPCERQREIKGRMPLPSLNRALAGRPMTLSGAWQRWMGLPEGALRKSRLNQLTNLSNPSRKSRLCFIRVHELQRARVLDSRARAGAVRIPGSCEPDCGHDQDGVPHAEALPTTTTSYRSQAKRFGTGLRTRAALVVSSALASAPETSPM